MSFMCSLHLTLFSYMYGEKFGRGSKVSKVSSIKIVSFSLSRHFSIADLDINFGSF